jgi:MFS family permease
VTGRTRWITIVLLIGSVGLAFADASVVALALPELYSEFDTTIVAVSWVLAIYALSVVVAGIVGLGLVGRVNMAHLSATGAALFAAGSIASGAAPDLTALLAARAVQGVGGAWLVMGSLSVLRSLLGSAASATRAWSLAGTFGAVLGPALGGVLTQAFDWRAVFYVQAPIALGAVVVATVRTDPEPTKVRRPRAAAMADAGLFGVFGALVGALFLSVILLVVVWGYDPITGAAVVTALPIGTVAALSTRGRVDERTMAVSGGLLLCGGLLTLALIPGVEPAWAAVALGMCGAGYGAMTGVLGPIAVPDGSGARSATLSSVGRHLGLVVGLGLIAPILSIDVDMAIDDAPFPATASVLDAPIGTATKVRLSLDIVELLDAASDGEVPDLTEVFERHGSSDDADLAGLQVRVETQVREVFTLAFRAAFAVAAAMALLAAVVAYVTLGMRSGGWGLGAVALITLLIGLAVPITAYSSGGSNVGEVILVDPCTAGPDPFPSKGFDAMLQRMVLSGLNGAACDLGVGREELVLSIDPSSGVDTVDWNGDSIEEALRSGVSRAIDDADERNTLPGPFAWLFHEAADRAPVSWFLDRLGVD